MKSENVGVLRFTFEQIARAEKRDADLRFLKAKRETMPTKDRVTDHGLDGYARGFEAGWSAMREYLLSEGILKYDLNQKN